MDPTLSQIATLTPMARAHAIAVTDALRAAGLPAVVFEGFRSKAQQRALWARGRSVPGRIVTHTLQSRHFGRTAWDTVFLVNGRLTWNVPAAWWEYLGAVGESYGLRWGGRWRRLRDRPHLEMP